MGYYTHHELEFDGDLSIDHRGEINKASGRFGLFEDEAKWYDHEIDMRKYSVRYPDVLFTLSGEGEESDDLWVEYHKNGKMQRSKAVITFDDFDESRLG